MPKYDNLLLFSLGSSPKLAEEIATILGMKLSPCTVTHFADGEIFCRPDVPVKGKKVYVVQSTCKPVTERLMEVLVFVDALKNAHAREINVIVPYYGYARQDRMVHRAEPVTAKMTAKLFEAVGADKVITLDIHSQQIASFFDIPVDNLSATSVFASYCRKLVKQRGLDFSELTIVSPDHGGIHRARRLSMALDNLPMAVVDKRRPRPNVAEIVSVIGEVKDRVCILIDDMIDTGGTIAGTARNLLTNGAKEVHVCASHGVFSNGAVEKLFDAGISSLAITNSIEREDDRIVSLSVASLFAELVESDLGHRDVPIEYMAFY